MTIGLTPLEDTLVLTAGADFEHLLEPETEYPAGMTARIAFYASARTDAEEIDSWPATVAGPSEVSWRIESEIADAVPKRTYYRLYAIFAGTPTLERCWYLGRVERQQ